MKLADVVIEKLSPIRKAIMEYLNEPQYLNQVLLKGAEKAKSIASTNWLEVRNKVGFGFDASSLNLTTNKKSKAVS